MERKLWTHSKPCAFHPGAECLLICTERLVNLLANLYFLAGLGA